MTWEKVQCVNVCHVVFAIYLDGHDLGIGVDGTVLDSVFGHVLWDQIIIVALEIVCRHHSIFVLRCEEPRAELI